MDDLRFLLVTLVVGVWMHHGSSATTTRRSTKRVLGRGYVAEERREGHPHPLSLSQSARQHINHLTKTDAKEEASC